MIKIRITFVDNEEGCKELSDSISNIEKEFDIINKSKIYKGRGASLYSNIYIDATPKRKWTTMFFLSLKYLCDILKIE